MVQKNLLTEFQQCTKLIIDKLDFINPEVDFRKFETEKLGIDYIAFIQHSEGTAKFYVKTLTDTVDLSIWTKIYCSIHFYNSQDLLLFSQFDIFGDIVAFDISKMNSINKNEIDLELGYRNEIKLYRWVEINLDNFLLEKEKNKLEILFGNCPIKLYGDWGISISSVLSFEIALRGYAALKPDEILIYKMKHYEEDSVVYSYAVFHSLRYGVYDYSYWSIFPAFCSPDSGTANVALLQAENAIEEIKDHVKIVVKEITIDYNDLKNKFLFLVDDNKKKIENFDPFRINKKLDEIIDKVDDLQPDNRYLELIVDILENNRDKIPELKTQMDEILKKMNESEDIKHKLKISFPIIPKLISYEQERKISPNFSKQIKELKNYL